MMNQARIPLDLFEGQMAEQRYAMFEEENKLCVHVLAQALLLRGREMRTGFSFPQSGADFQ